MAALIQLKTMVTKLFMKGNNKMSTNYINYYKSFNLSTLHKTREYYQAEINYILDKELIGHNKSQLDNYSKRISAINIAIKDRLSTKEYEPI